MRIGQTGASHSDTESDLECPSDGADADGSESGDADNGGISDVHVHVQDHHHEVLDTPHAATHIDLNACSGIDAKIAASQDHHIRHDAIPTPPSECPFTKPEFLATFTQAFKEINASGIVPPCYGVLESEWPIDGYGTHEFISLGSRGRRVAVELPFSVWWPRAVAWTQGLDLMDRLLYLDN